MAQDSIKFIDKIVCLSFTGKVESGDAEGAEKRVAALQKRPLRVLLDMKKAELPDSNSWNEFKQLLTDMPYQRMALFGDRPKIVAVLGLLLKSITKANNVKLFRDEELAKQWLLSRS